MSKKTGGLPRTITISIRDGDSMWSVCAMRDGKTVAMHAFNNPISAGACLAMALMQLASDIQVEAAREAGFEILDLMEGTKA